MQKISSVFCQIPFGDTFRLLSHWSAMNFGPMTNNSWSSISHLLDIDSPVTTPAVLSHLTGQIARGLYRFEWSAFCEFSRLFPSSLVTNLEGIAPDMIDVPVVQFCRLFSALLTREIDRHKSHEAPFEGGVKRSTKNAGQTHLDLVFWFWFLGDSGPVQKGVRIRFHLVDIEKSCFQSRRIALRERYHPSALVWQGPK